MEKEHELTFNEIYKKYYKAVIFEKKHYIENYFEIVYDLLKLQMKNNVNNIDLRKVNYYCNLVNKLKNIPSPIKEAFSIIAKDYKYLKITKNIDYFYKDYFQLYETNQDNYIYLDDIRDNVKYSMGVINNKDKKIIEEIIENKYNIIDKNFKKIFENLLKE